MLSKEEKEMYKSYNMIKAQEARVIELANKLGKFRSIKGGIDMQSIAQLTRRTLTQHGFPIFGNYDKDRDKRPRRDIARVEMEQEQVQIEQEQVQTKDGKKKDKRKTPTEQARERVLFSDWMNASEENRKMIQDACRHSFIEKMYEELLADMEICRMEEWDVFEYPRMLRVAIDRCIPKVRQLTLNF